MTALGLLNQNPGVSTLDLARHINRGANAIGLTIAIYNEAVAIGAVREVAKDLLVREILHEFPAGWSKKGDVAAGIGLASWYSQICDYAGDPAFSVCAANIIRQLIVDSSPAEGWKPQVQDDVVIDELFHRYWPI
jgi:hypothetical protein